MGFSSTLSALETPRGVEKCFNFYTFKTKKKMLRFIAISCLVAVCAAQTIDPKDAKILKEQRFNSGDGRTGSAFATEDGKIFREETNAQGERIGQYSYIDENGKTITVKYTAGKDGFRILEGDHIRATGQQAAPFNPAEAAPAPAPAPVRAAAPIVQPQAIAAPVFNDYDEVEADPNRNPFVNPHDSSHGGILAGQLAGHLAGAQQIPQLNPRVVPQQPARPVIVPTSTVSPARFFPPGQLKLNRFEDGFNFDFES